MPAYALLCMGDVTELCWAVFHKVLQLVTRFAW